MSLNGQFLGYMANSVLHTDAPAVRLAVVFDLPAIAGKTEAEVTAVLGNPSGRETERSQYGTHPRVMYRDGQVEVVFLNGRAEWMTLYNDAGTFRFSQTILQQLNVPNRQPAFVNPQYVMRWERIPEALSLSVFGDGQQGVRYVHVIVSTMP